MNGKINLSCLALLLIGSIFLPAVEISNLEGTVIDVEILETEPSRVQIRMADGHVLWLERDQLSAETNRMLDAEALAEHEAYKALNDLLGIPLFADRELWDDATGAVAGRLGWPKESETNSQSSYRLYPPADYRMLGCRPYSAALYGDRGKAQRLSIVFVNKGDFLLASQDGEYVNLKIMTTDAADNKGRGEKLSDARLRDLSTGNIKTRENGDVLIGNIPMVDQGPKGYCVPATFERYNKETGEIAVSDSWGPSYRERWIPAEQVSQGSIYLVEF